MMFAVKRAWCMGLAVLGLAALPVWSLAQVNDTEKSLQEAEKALRAAQAAQAQLLWRMSSLGASRLGAALESPSAAVANQLDLPAGQGQVVKSVQANSAAAKAGIQANDIILEIDGKAVSSSLPEFEKAVNSLKPETAVEVVVLRKGQKMTIKGLMVPRIEQPAQFNQFGQLQPGVTTVQARNMPVVPQVPGPIVPLDVQGQLRLTAEQREKL